MPPKARPPALPPIVQAGHPVLRERAQPVDPKDIKAPETQLLVSTMVAVMRAAPGVGLAAPQIGVGRQIIVIEDPEKFVSDMSQADRNTLERVSFPLKVLFNPTLTVVGTHAKATFREGCLSVAGYSAHVARDLEVVVDALDGDGQPFHWQVRGWPARILQHEVDHLMGTLYIDRMDSRSFSAE